MRFRVLGPLEVWHDGVQRNLGARLERALLALLVLNRNEVVPLAALADRSAHEQGDSGGSTRRARPRLRPDLAAAVVGDSLWLRSDSGIVRFDRRSGRVRGRLALASYANVPENGRLATGAGSLWVPDIHNSVVWRVDLATGKRVASIHVRGQPAGVAFGAGAAWLADANTGTISRVDPSTNEVVTRISVDGAPSSLAFGFGRVWVAVD